MSKKRSSFKRSEHHRIYLQVPVYGDTDGMQLNRAARRLLKHAQKKPRQMRLNPLGRDTTREFADAHIRR